MNERSDRRGAPRRGTGNKNRPPEPALPDSVTPRDLDPAVRRDLSSLDKTNSENVARHLVMVSQLLAEDPALALEHARAAQRRAGRIAVVRETLGVAAYSAGEWAEALTELRAAKRMSGDVSLLPLIADCERGLGRPERAVEVARSEEARALTGEGAAELRIVESGARLDLGEPEKAIVTLQTADLDPSRQGTEAARYFYAYAAALLAGGRRDDAITWFMNAAAADIDDETDAELRLTELAEDGASSFATDAVPTEPLTERYDAILADLDGTVYAGKDEIPGASGALAGLNVYYVTNNASRRPAEVAEHLTELGFETTVDRVVTSAQSAARLLADQLPPGALVLVVGTDGLADEVREVGLTVTRSADDKPAAVVQGHSTETDWAMLSEAVLAVNAGALWVACNIDPTLPTERGFAVGNGSMVAAVAHATGKRSQVAGKPAAPLMKDSIAAANAERPLVVGDRLDTDIAGANEVGADSLLVLTGVSSALDAVRAEPAQRPTYVARDLAGLAQKLAPAAAGAPGWRIEVQGNQLRATRSADATDEGLLPALLAAAWSAADRTDWVVVAGDDAASAIDHWGLDLG
ncbi:HAD-IIA family hydrolase [Jongsikchunia kroppenstedtii]|uniref:HAD-IIA family hydrolase n=1 Tax=Jongsikchunia kroppenstedtii TaxID=1121721 RepID=UPI00036E2CF2|nr:HAD-IIA family hydrolase [Jongsikchunia kroppenstedtii]